VVSSGVKRRRRALRMAENRTDYTIEAIA